MLLIKNNPKKHACFNPLRKEISFFSQWIYVLVYIIFLSLFNPLYAETVITNTATVNFSIFNNSQQLSDSVQFTKDTVVTPPDEITLSKQADTSNVEVGDLISYTLTVNNPNTTSLTNLVIQDILPPGVSYILNSAKLNNISIAAANINYSANLLNISLGDIPPNSSWSVNYKLKALTQGFKLNKATVSSDTATSQIAQAAVEVSEPVVPPTIPLTLSKTANKEKVVLGDTIEYQITINNPNNKPINGTVLHDIFPTNLVYIPNSAFLNNNPINVSTANGLTFNLGLMPAGAQWILKYKTKLESITGIKILTNKANVTSSDTAANSNTASESVEISDEKILLSKTADKTKATVGDTVVYTINITNPEDHTLANIVISDALPKGFVYKASSAKLNGVVLANSAVQLVGEQLSLSIQSLDVGKTATINYTLTVTDEAPLGIAINSALANSDLAQSTAATATVTVVSPIFPIKLKKEANLEKVKLGDIIEYSLHIENLNNQAIENTIINDQLPIGLAFLENSAELNGSKIIANTSAGLSLNLGTIPSKTNWLLKYKTKVVNTTGIDSLTNIASITTQNSIADSNIAKTTTEISHERIELKKTANKSKAAINDRIEYTITVKNPENHPLSNVSVNDTLPQGFVYQTGSIRLNGKKSSNLNVQADNRNLRFSIASIGAGKTITLKYEVLVTSLSKLGKADNIAKATSQFAQSAVAKASVKIRTPSTIKFLKINENGVKSTISPTSYNSNKNGTPKWQSVTSVALSNGAIIALPSQQPLIETEQFALSDTIVVEVQDADQNTDPSKIESIVVVIEASGSGDKEILMLQETSPDSGIFVGVIITTSAPTKIQNGLLSLQEGSTVSAVYHDEEDSTDTSIQAALVVPNTQITLTKEADKDSSSIGEQVKYTLAFTNNSNFLIPQFVLKDTLPLGFKYLQNTATLNGHKLSNEVVSNGRTLNFNLSKMPIGQTWRLEYLTKITAGVQVGNAINTAFIDAIKFKSNNAKAKVLIKDDLMRTKNILTGRVYIGCKTNKGSKVLENVRIFNEMGRSILTDNNGFWHMEGIQPGTHVLQIDEESLPDGYEIMTCQENTRFAGNPRSQFVNLIAGSIWQVDFHVKRKSSFDVSSNQAENKIAEEALNPVNLFDKTYLETASDSFEILWPKNNFVPDVASTKIFVKSSPKLKVEVFLNGKKVNPLNYDGSKTNKSRTAIIRRWFGVDLDIINRDNTLLVIAKDKSGKEVARKTHNIHFSGQPSSAEFLPEKSVLIADGKTTPSIALLIRDEDGYPMRANTSGNFNLEDSRYQVKDTQSNTEEVNLNKSSSGNYEYQINNNGIARIELNPTTQSGEIKLLLKFRHAKDKVIRTWLKPKLRNWILVGLAEGTVSYNTLSGNMRALDDLNKSDKFYKQGRIAFFAKGRIKGKYLLTMAYDTHKSSQEVGSQLEGNIDPDAWYTIYGDNSNNQYNAPSSRKLYLKIEKENFYALFGDYRSDMNVAELANYERTLNGLKSEYKSKKFSYNAFISETSNQHHHEEIAGDGTSGLYRLNHSILNNSETIKIETRDRFHSERIIETKELVRYQDYQIDYEAGTLFFKFPITSRDKNFNPNIIVIDYDSETNNNSEIVAGGRAAFKTDNEKLEVGISALHIGRNKTKNDSLIGIDSTYKFTPDTKLHVELAQSKTEKSQHKSVNAQIIELEKQIADLETKLYFRKEYKNFGIDTQASETGIRKMGAELLYKVNKNTKIKAEISDQKNLNDNGKRLLAETEVEYRYKNIDVSAGLRHTKEKFSDKSDISNNTALLGAKYTTESGKITLRSNIEKNIGDKNDSEISPDKAIIGVDLKLQKGFVVFAEHEVTNNAKTTTHNSRIGVSKDLWKGAQAKTTYTKERTDEGQRNYATLGLSQKINITDKLKADFSIDHAKTIGDTQKQFNENSPQQNGAVRDDYTAFSVGLGWNEKDWSWTSRFETRKGDIEDKINFTAGIIRRLEDGKQLSGKISYYDSDSSTGERKTSSKLSFGSAWHPSDNNFVFFSRLDLTTEKIKQSSDDEQVNTNTNTQKIIHNLHYNRKINKKTQLSVHHGIKYVIDQNKDLKHKATIDTATAELRYDINKKWDLGIKGGYLHDWTDKVTESVVGVSVGVTPAKNAWVELGYNFEGFNDEDFDDNNYKRKGAYLSFRYKFDQDSLNGKDLPIRTTTVKQN